MIKQILGAGFVILIISTVLIYLLQRHLIYFPAKEMPSRQVFHAEDMQQVTLQTSDDLFLHAWYKPANPGKPTLLYLPGNAGHIGFRMPLVRQFLDEGIGVLLVEYRGYGGNKGHPTEQGLYQDGRAALRFLQQQRIDAKNLVLFGESIGTGVAVFLATESPFCALILQSPYTSLAAVARFHYPWIFLKPWDKFDSSTHIKNVKIPLLILHGNQDEIVPYAQGIALFHQAREPKYIVTLANKGHNNLWNRHFFNEINRFISANCL